MLKYHNNEHKRSSKKKVLSFFLRFKMKTSKLKSPLIEISKLIFSRLIFLEVFLKSLN
jgi:hypothetical protein